MSLYPQFFNKEDTKNLLFKNFLIFLKRSILRFISMAGNIPASERTEYLPDIKLLCSIISAPNLSAIKLKALSFVSGVALILFFNPRF